MAGASHIDRVELSYACPFSEDQVWKVVEGVAGRLVPWEEPSTFTSEERGFLPGDARAGWERWTAPGAELTVRRRPGGPDRRGTDKIKREYDLQLQSGFSLLLTCAGPSPTEEELHATLRHLRPEDFDLVHRLFNEVFGSEADKSMEGPLVTRNVEAALAAGYGAFARDLIDQAMRALPRGGSRPPTKNQLWWDRLQELRQAIPGKGLPPDHDSP